LSIRGYLKIVETIKGLHHKHLVVGGGGYNLEVVPKAWSRAMAVLLGHDIDIPFEASHTTSQTGRDYARMMVKEVKGRIFPFFGLDD
jgi:acetoin utilization deacetylase AcuC-like enzyme